MQQRILCKVKCSFNNATYTSIVLVAKTLFIMKSYGHNINQRNYLLKEVANFVTVHIFITIMFIDALSF